MTRTSRTTLPATLGALMLCICVAFSMPVTAQPSSVHGNWQPESEFQGKFDWVQMKSGEWLKGEILVMYEDELEFDSDEFDEQMLDWGDIKTIHSSQIMNVGFEDQTTAVGILILEGNTVRVVGDDATVERNRNEVLSITAGRPKEINFWDMKLYLGVVLRSGNSNVVENTIQANFKRRTVRNRIIVDFISNNNRTEGETVADNQRATAGWDRFINKRFFVQPVYGEYFRDPFQNIAARWTVGVGAGYQLIDSPKVDWSVSGGPAYQENQFDDVIPGSPEEETTPALVVGTKSSWDITKWMEFDGEYRFQVVNEESGTYNHHMVLSFETDITSLIDFDVTWVWDRIQDPRANSDGSVPEQDDFRTTVGLTFDW